MPSRIDDPRDDQDRGCALAWMETGDARMMETLKKSRIEHKPADHVMIVGESFP